MFHFITDKPKMKIDPESNKRCFSLLASHVKHICNETSRL